MKEKNKKDNKEENGIIKPLTVRLEDSKNEIIETINKVAEENELSFFFLELIIAPIHQEILIQKDNEALREREAYEQTLKEEEGTKDE